MTTLRNSTRRQRPNGFTLMELLIVISIMLILMLMAIPNFNKMRITAHETSAMNSLRTIYQTEIQYQTTYPQNGFSCSMQTLGGDPKQGAPSATSAQLLQGDLPAGIKDGYTFSIVNCSKVTVNNVDQITGYEVTAVPQAVGKTGNRGFCIDQYGEIKVDPCGRRQLHIKYPVSRLRIASIVFAICCASLPGCNFLPGSISGSGQQMTPSANDLARRVDEHYNHLQSLKTNFNEQYDGLGMHRSESGVMMLRKPGRMRWQYQSTAGKVFVLDGKYAWFYAPGDTQVQRIAASQLDDLAVASSLSARPHQDRKRTDGPYARASRAVGNLRSLRLQPKAPAEAHRKIVAECDSHRRHYRH